MGNNWGASDEGAGLVLEDGGTQHIWQQMSDPAEVGKDLRESCGNDDNRTQNSGRWGLKDTNEMLVFLAGFGALVIP